MSRASTANGLFSRALQLVDQLRWPSTPTARGAYLGRRGGSHRGLLRGAGVEFSEHRSYAPGDDLRHLDWRALARQDRLYIKRYEVEVHRRAVVALDNSASMELRDASDGNTVDKWRAVQLLVASLMLQLDRLGYATSLQTLGERRHRWPGGPVDEAIELLASISPKGAAVPPLSAADVTHGAQTFLITDGLWPVADIGAMLSGLRQAGGQPVLLHTLAPAELNFDFAGSVALRCPETGARVRVHAASVRRRYTAMMEQHVRSLRELCVQLGVLYHLTDLGGAPLKHLRDWTCLATEGAP